MTVADRLLVLGAGTMGSQIAQQAALGGANVLLVDTARAQLQRAVASNRTHLERRVDKGRLDANAAVTALARVVISDDLSAAAESDWAIEAIVEEVDAKRAAFRDLDRVLPAHAGIASNSSNIVISRVADATGRPELCCNMHFFHPVLVMEICEVGRGPATSDETVDRAITWCRWMNRRPVLVEREVDGFIVNRILGAASREAFSLLADDIASVADIDEAARSGLNWPLGPFQLADFSGIDVVLGVRRDRALRDHQPGDEATVTILQRLVDAGRLGRKSGCGFYDYTSPPPVSVALP